MKKIIIALFLSVIMLLCGCGENLRSIADTEPPSSNMPEAPVTVTPEATPEISAAGHPEEPQAVYVPVTPTPAKDSKTALLNSVLARVKSNVDTGTFEGFTGESTLQDVVEGTEMKLHEARVTYAVDFLSFPANMACHFTPVLNSLTFYIHPDKRTDYEEKMTDVISKLDDALDGLVKTQSQQGEWDYYTWKAGAYSVDMRTNEAVYENSGILAVITVKKLSDTIIPSIPDIFHYQFGTDFDTVYENESPSKVRDEGMGFGNIKYIKDGIEIYFGFVIDESKNKVILNDGIYQFSVNMPDFDAAVDFIDVAADSFQTVMGAPKSREYGHGEEDSFETAEELKESGCQEFWLDMWWESIELSPAYDPDNGVLFYLSFDNSYFKNAASGE